MSAVPPSPTLTRRVHLAFQPFVGTPEVVADLGLQPREEGGELTLLGFALPDGAIDWYVLDDGIRRLILEGLTGGVVVPQAVLPPGVNGR